MRTYSWAFTPQMVTHNLVSRCRGALRQAIDTRREGIARGFDHESGGLGASHCKAGCRARRWPGCWIIHAFARKASVVPDSGNVTTTAGVL